MNVTSQDCARGRAPAGAVQNPRDAWYGALGSAALTVLTMLCASMMALPAFAQTLPALAEEPWLIVATRLGPTTAEARLVFGPDGDVTGSTGCNSFRTRAETAPAATVPDQTTRTETGPSETALAETGPQLSGRLVFTGPMRATERACLDRDLAAQERA
ncbi:MAG: hypothetical protein AAFR46_20095, partial [Pseudomonadota bacterium]